MTIRKITEGVRQLSALDWNRRLFDGLIPLPDGTTYNAYLVEGVKENALIDAVDPTKQELLIEDLHDAGVGRLDYIIANHAEQDHSGGITRVLEEYPNAKVLANQKCAQLLQEHLTIPKENFKITEDREMISLGGKTLEFINAPWVHWPETMLTYLHEDSMLFSCDLFGSHLASSSLYAKEGGRILDSAKRYYAEIMMPFRPMIKNHMETIKQLDVNIIAPSHGPVYKKPRLIMDSYAQWVSDDVKNMAVIPYVSMHGSTEKMVCRLTDGLIANGVEATQFDLTKTDLGELAMSLVDAATIIIATPTVLGGPHPQAVYAAYLANLLKPKTRLAGVVCSYGWGGRAVEQLSGMLGSLKAELLEPLEVRGRPKEEDMKRLDLLAEKIAEKHRGYKIL